MFFGSKGVFPPGITQSHTTEFEVSTASHDFVTNGY